MTLYSGLFVAEGSSDAPLAGLVTELFAAHDIRLRLQEPDFTWLRVAKDVQSKVHAGIELAKTNFDVVVVHRDADNAGHAARTREIVDAVATVTRGSHVVPVVPVRMTEAWLLLDEAAIRRVAGNPKGRAGLGLPKPHEVESVADPKHVLKQCLLAAADCTGRRHNQVARRFDEHRRNLLERLDPHGPVTKLASWQRLVDSVAAAAELMA
ncbi:DUF4276 family protein [Kutzneria buriramensis]|uniref:Uncharacterized protein DUF4276 n=1 Tax=Kutzneria buriramensis TaxID=1045776 RepID=A0A3E0IAJ7_9PSEU|nr:DUF4276 family protein [Kutzneria buriramensis]REH55697.1 uncharacterized protein DUF4276 [Kutzneria buriramensis]